MVILSHSKMPFGLNVRETLIAEMCTDVINLAFPIQTLFLPDPFKTNTSLHWVSLSFLGNFFLFTENVKLKSIKLFKKPRKGSRTDGALVSKVRN